MTRAAALALLALSALAAERNGISNGSFESGMDAWDTAGDASGVTLDSAIAHTGAHSVRLSAAVAGVHHSGVHQSLHFTAPFQHPVRVSAWSRAQAIEAEAFDFWIQGEYADGTKIEREGATLGLGTHPWQHSEFIFDPHKPVKSLEFLAVLINGKGTAWLDDIELTLAPFAFHGITVDANSGAVAGLTVKAPWKAELRGASGIAASATGDAPPVKLHWSAAPGNYTLHLTATDALREETLDETRRIHVTRARPLSVWVESSMTRVFPHTLPGAAATAQISLAGNEYESFQLCLLAPGEIKNVRVETGDLVSRSGRRIPASEIEWQQVAYVPVPTLRRSAANDNAFPGWWPDPLLHVERFDLQPGFTQPVWITVYAPSGTPPGDYRGEVRVLAGDRPPLTIPLRATVYGFSLPAASHLQTAFALLDSELEALYGGALTPELRRAYGDFLLRHRLNPDDIYRTRTPDLADLQRYVPRGLNAFNLLYLIPEKGPLIPELGAYTPDLRQLLLERLAPRIPALRDAGLLPQAYVYGFDESDPEFFPAIRDYFGEIHRRFPGLRTLTTAHIPLDPAQVRSLNVDAIVPLTANYNFEKAEACRRAGLQVWSYVAVGPREPYANFLADDPLIEARILPWQAYQQKFDGLLYWGVNIWERRGNRRPLDPARGPLLEWNITTGTANDERWLRELHGDGLLLYPAARGPIGSIRLANLRDGLEDYEYLWLSRNAAAPLPVTRDLITFTLDPAVLYATREKIARRLESR